LHLILHPASGILYRASSRPLPSSVNCQLSTVMRTRDNYMILTCRSSLLSFTPHSRSLWQTIRYHLF